jgi:hypothetical protein
MSMVCPTCDVVHEQKLTCPTCGGRLHYRSAGERPRPVGPGGRWLHSAWGRLLLGLVLAQGLTYAFRQLYTALELAFHDQLILNDADPRVYVLLQGLQLTALVVGGVLAGGGQRAGAFLGALLGVANGALLLAFHPGPAASAPVAWVSQPLLHGVFGGVAGWIGASVWKPLPAPAGPAASRLVARLGAARKALSLFAGRVAWVRVAVGASLAVFGSLFATLMLELAVHAADSRGYVATPAYEIQYMRDRILTWEVKALAILAGAALAGVNTRNGFKQGLFVGVLVVLVLSGALAAQGQATLAILAGTVISALCLSIVGGWFGSQLLPPVVSARRPRGVGATAF